MPALEVVPSLPAQSFEEIQSLVTSFDGSLEELQIDIVDGVFVPLRSWPFTTTSDTPKEELQRISELPDSLSIEMDCMVCNPEEYLDIFVSLGVARVIVHLGSTEAYDDIIDHSKEHNYKLGFALTNDISLYFLEQYIETIDFVQIMGIKHVGQQGQPFDERTLITAQSLRTKYPDLHIAVDGSVNETTIIQLRDAGVNRFAPGSAVAKAGNPQEAYQHLWRLLDTHL